MDKIKLGLLFIFGGLAYGSLLIDGIYNRTLGYLIEHRWIIPPVVKKVNPNALGRKITIFLYSVSLIIIGLYLLWKRNI